MTPSPTVLIVDDDPGVYESIRLWLEDDGFEVRVAPTGADALRLLAAAPVDAALVDLQLPDMSGEEFLCQALSANPAVKFMIHTGASCYRLSTDLRRLGMEENDILYKPVVDLPLFSETIRRKVAGEEGA